MVDTQVKDERVLAEESGRKGCRKARQRLALGDKDGESVDDCEEKDLTREMQGLYTRTRKATVVMVVLSAREALIHNSLVPGPA